MPRIALILTIAVCAVLINLSVCDELPVDGPGAMFYNKKSNWLVHIDINADRTPTDPNELVYLVDPEHDYYPEGVYTLYQWLYIPSTTEGKGCYHIVYGADKNFALEIATESLVSKVKLAPFDAHRKAQIWTFKQIGEFWQIQNKLTKGVWSYTLNPEEDNKRAFLMVKPKKAGCDEQVWDIDTVRDWGSNDIEN